MKAGPRRSSVIRFAVAPIVEAVRLRMKEEKLVRKARTARLQKEREGSDWRNSKQSLRLRRKFWPSAWRRQMPERLCSTGAAWPDGSQWLTRHCVQHASPQSKSCPRNQIKRRSSRLIRGGFFAVRSGQQRYQIALQVEIVPRLLRIPTDSDPRDRPVQLVRSAPDNILALQRLRDPFDIIPVERSEFLGKLDHIALIGLGFRSERRQLLLGVGQPFEDRRVRPSGSDGIAEALQLLLQAPNGGSALRIALARAAV